MGGFVCKQSVAEVRRRAALKVVVREEEEEEKREIAIAVVAVLLVGERGEGAQTFSLRGLRNLRLRACLSVAGTTYLTHCP